jgi:hypothetical protein
MSGQNWRKNNERDQLDFVRYLGLQQNAEDSNYLWVATDCLYKADGHQLT